MNSDLQTALTVGLYVLVGLTVLYVIWIIVFLTFFRKIWKSASSDPTWNRTVRYDNTRGRRR